MSGTALALTFFAYDTTLPFDIAAHGRATRTFGLDLADLDGQAIGLLPASVELFDVGRNELAAVDTVTDVRGSILSVYGVFGIAVLLLTIAAWVTCLCSPWPAIASPPIACAGPCASCPPVSAPAWSPS
ncbi:hypothetical protein [Kutzneria kofuensis]|uniref:hypothetical protein n=1 Tax=Kutzneria kofuensis TaxID=103725 RepID=UPI0031E8BCAD